MKAWRLREAPSAPAEVSDDLGPQRSWEQRTIMLVHDRDRTDEICAEWEEAGWLVMTIDDVTPNGSQLTMHAVRVAVPPST